MVTASRGKAVRAEPVALLYEQGRVFHANAGESATGGGLRKLEEQLCQMTVTGFVGEGSPDRCDALVWAISQLARGGASATVIVGASGSDKASHWRS